MTHEKDWDEKYPISLNLLNDKRRHRENFWCLVGCQVTWKENQTSNIESRPTCCFCTECCCEWRWWSEIKLNNASDKEWCQVESKLQAECRGIYDLIENLLMLIDNFTRNIVEVIMISFVFLSFVCLSVGLFGRRGWLIKQPLHNKALRQTRSWDGNVCVRDAFDKSLERSNNSKLISRCEQCDLAVFSSFPTLYRRLRHFILISNSFYLFNLLFSLRGTEAKFGFRITAMKWEERLSGLHKRCDERFSGFARRFARCTKRVVSEKITEREKVLKFNVFYRWTWN